MSWNYRVIEHKTPTKFSPDEVQLSVHEVYYDEGKQPYTWTAEAARPKGETLEELAKDLHMMSQALNKPILHETIDEHNNPILL